MDKENNNNKKMTMPVDEVKRHMSALSEDFKEQVKGVAESVKITRDTLTQRLNEVETNISKKIDTTNEMVAKNTEGIKEIKEKIEGHKERITKLEEAKV